MPDADGVADGDDNVSGARRLCGRGRGEQKEGTRMKKDEVKAKEKRVTGAKEFQNKEGGGGGRGRSE